MTAIIAAMDEEIELLKAAARKLESREVCGIECFVCEFNGIETVIIKSGIGKTAAASATAVAISEFGANEVINTGLAAGRFGQGTVMLATACTQHDFDATADGEPLGKNPDFPFLYYTADKELNARLKNVLEKSGVKYVETVIASGDAFIADKNRMNAICSHFQAGGVDMESGAVAQVCTKAHVPFASLRCISDGGDSIEDYYSFMHAACENFTKVILSYFS